MTGCGPDYSSHQWEWRGTRLVCADCGLVDLAAARLVEHVTAGLADAGYQLVRTPRRD